jgi:Protein of unknown function (DUF2934)
MILGAGRKHSKGGEKPKIVVVEANEQARRVQEAVARRAYQIFERRGSASWHELEDWRQAEAELVRPCCSGRMSVDGTLWMGTDAAAFEKDTIEIWVAPHRLTVCGKPRAAKENAAPVTERSGSYPDGGMIFHVIELSCEIDPSRVTAKTNDSSLDILLTKAGTKAELQVKAVA